MICLRPCQDGWTKNPKCKSALGMILDQNRASPLTILIQNVNPHTTHDLLKIPSDRTDDATDLFLNFLHRIFHFTPPKRNSGTLQWL